MTRYGAVVAQLPATSTRSPATSTVAWSRTALARVRPDLAGVGTRVNLEVTINHRYELVGAHVARLPLFNPPRKTA